MPFPNLDGRPSEYTDEVVNKLPEYIDWCKENESLPKRAGFALYIGISKPTLLTWAKNNEQLFNALAELDTFQENQLVDGSLFNKMNSVIAKLLLSNHGYSDKIQNENTNINVEVEQDETKPVEERLQEVLKRIKEVQK